jgi:hypothetical protein
MRTHPITADMRREISCFALAKLAASTGRRDFHFSISRPTAITSAFLRRITETYGPAWISQVCRRLNDE